MNKCILAKQNYTAIKYLLIINVVLTFYYNELVYIMPAPQFGDESS
jgi:hypothetical protein